MTFDSFDFCFMNITDKNIPKKKIIMITNITRDMELVVYVKKPMRGLRTKKSGTTFIFTLFLHCFLVIFS